jgi:hypothetical protein
MAIFIYRVIQFPEVARIREDRGGLSSSLSTTSGFLFTDPYAREKSNEQKFPLSFVLIYFLVR